ncbi:hypothetical protein Tco_0341721, partial [Tanacetum coccineum]
DIIAEFCGPSRWIELSKEMSSKILLCGDGSCWKTFKPIASLIVKCSIGKTRGLLSFSMGIGKQIASPNHVALSVISSISSSNEPKSRVFPPNAIQSKLLLKPSMGSLIPTQGFQDAVIHDPDMNKKIPETIESFTKISSDLTELMFFVKGFDYSDLQSTVKDL